MSAPRPPVVAGVGGGVGVTTLSVALRCRDGGRADGRGPGPDVLACRDTLDSVVRAAALLDEVDAAARPVLAVTLGGLRRPYGPVRARLDQLADAAGAVVLLPHVGRWRTLAEPLTEVAGLLDASPLPRPLRAYAAAVRELAAAVVASGRLEAGTDGAAPGRERVAGDTRTRRASGPAPDARRPIDGSTDERTAVRRTDEQRTRPTAPRAASPRDARPTTGPVTPAWTSAPATTSPTTRPGSQPWTLATPPAAPTASWAADARPSPTTTTPTAGPATQPWTRTTPPAGPATTRRADPRAPAAARPPSTPPTGVPRPAPATPPRGTPAASTGPAPVVVAAFRPAVGPVTYDDPLADPWRPAPPAAEAPPAPTPPRRRGVRIVTEPPRPRDPAVVPLRPGTDDTAPLGGRPSADPRIEQVG